MDAETGKGPGTAPFAQIIAHMQTSDLLALHRRLTRHLRLIQLRHRAVGDELRVRAGGRRNVNKYGR